MKEASRVSLAYVGTFAWAVAVQVYCKARAMVAHRAHKAAGGKEKLNMYTDPLMLVGNRSVGNWLEWSPSFLVLFWVNAVLTGENISVGWVYVASRVAYPLLALAGGIKPSGVKGPIFVATLPGYWVLLKYAHDIFKHVRA